MADLEKELVEQQMQIVGVDAVTPVKTIAIGSETALQVNLAGGDSTSIFLSIANRLETNLVSSAIGDNTLLNLTVPTGKIWFLKGMSGSSSATALIKLIIASATELQFRVDANDVYGEPLYGYRVGAGVAVQIIVNVGATNKELIANLIIYEATT